jgi:hypothetical protein
MFLTPSELQYMQDTQEAAMPDTCTLRTVSYPSDGSGGWTEGTSASDLTNVPCRISYNGGSRLVEALKITPERDYIASFPVRFVVKPGMQVIHSGVTFNVISTNEGASWTTVRRATLRRAEVEGT